MEPVLDLELLRTFCEVVKAGELKKAAAAVFRSQAAVSMQIKRLEEQLGARLLERSNQGIRLTAAGETLLDYSKQLHINLCWSATIDQTAVQQVASCMQQAAAQLNSRQSGAA
ncbi:hypothetical protein A8C75_10005 [Marinobacterium aestuarii]|uniref:HTH lysR-type domain-containing protein n=1 Tax=Marinobacterium aestuarii TaxID=1821621 RepID=A0A1A9EZ71_9GAMM|nr:LysR family transcriptional regulator [Marinobacterium aestuarii]ANG62783.1 hypothetical protein A8C75_10005 [Marinobacterium aestuarii]